MKRSSIRLSLLTLVFCGVWMLPYSLTSAQNSPSQKFIVDEPAYMVEFKLAEITKRRDYTALIELMSSRFASEFKLTELELLAISIGLPSQQSPMQYVIQTKKSADPLMLLRFFQLVRTRDLPRTAKISGKTVYKYQRFGRSGSAYLPEDNLMVIGSNKNIEKLIRRERTSSSLLRSKRWRDLDNFHIRFAVGEDAIKEMSEGYTRFRNSGSSVDPMLKMFAEILEQIEIVSGGILLNQEVEFRCVLGGTSPSAAKNVEESLHAILQISKSMIPSFKDMMQAGARTDEQKKMANDGFDVLSKLVESIRVKRTGRDVHITAKANVAEFLKKTLPDAVKAAQIAAKRTQSANNLKQLGLAMHNYHDTHKQFPPAVIIGPKGHKHSWRIAMLPFLEEGELYNEYRFDEPWDSPNNTKIMRKMPAVFRHPNDPPESVNTHYLAFVGPGSPFANPEGAKIRDITDGTSNTVMFFSGATNVPWTKPVDIEYDPKKEVSLKNLPFKDGFNASFFDGSVRYFPGTIDPAKLHLYIQSADGNPIPQDGIRD